MSKTADRPDDPVVVFETSDVSLLPILRSVLDAAGIPCVIEGEEALGMLPMGGVGGSLSTGRKGIEARVLVPADRREEAATLLAETARVDDETE